MLTHHGKGTCQQTEVHFQVRVCPVSSRPSSWWNEQVQAGVTNHFLCVCERTWSDIVKQAWLVVAAVVLQSSSCVQLFATSWTAACQTSCHPLLSPSPTFNLSQHQGLLSHQIFFLEKKFRRLRNISIGSLFYYPANLFPTLMGENITIGLKSVTFYHHCVFAKARNHL